MITSQVFQIIDLNINNAVVLWVASHKCFILPLPIFFSALSYLNLPLAFNPGLHKSCLFKTHCPGESDVPLPLGSGLEYWQWHHSQVLRTSASAVDWTFPFPHTWAVSTATFTIWLATRFWECIVQHHSTAWRACRRVFSTLSHASGFYSFSNKVDILIYLEDL